MPGKHESSRTSSGILKTTTWGALIAFSAAILVTGLIGYSPWTHFGRLVNDSGAMWGMGAVWRTGAETSAESTSILGEN